MNDSSIGDMDVSSLFARKPVAVETLSLFTDEKIVTARNKVCVEWHHNVTISYTMIPDNRMGK